MEDSCSRVNGVLCTVTRSWLSFLHDESEWKNFESNIAWGVHELHQTFWFEQFFNGKLCCKICWACRLYFSGLVYSVLSLDECLIKINYGRFCVCLRCLEKVILWSRLCLAKNEFRYHRWHVYLICYLEWIIYGGKIIWCDLRTSKIYQFEGTVLVPVLIFVHKINTA